MENKFLEYCRLTHQNLTQALDALKVVDTHLELSQLDVRLVKIEADINQLRLELNQLAKIVDDNQSLNNSRFITLENNVQTQSSKLQDLTIETQQFQLDTRNDLGKLNSRILVLENKETIDVVELKNQVDQVQRRQQYPFRDTWYIVFDDNNLTRRTKAIRFSSTVEFFELDKTYPIWNVDVMGIGGATYYIKAQTVSFTRIGDPSRNCMKAFVKTSDYSYIYYLTL